MNTPQGKQRIDLIAHQNTDFRHEFPVVKNGEVPISPLWTGRMQVRTFVGTLVADAAVVVSGNGAPVATIARSALSEVGKYAYDLILQDPLSLRTKSFNGEFRIYQTQTDWDGGSSPFPPPDIGLIAGTAIEAFRVMAVGSDGKAVKADCLTPAHSKATYAINLFDAPIGAYTSPHIDGPIYNDGWDLLPGLAVYLGTDGQIVQSAPSSGFTLKIGVALSAKVLLFRPDESGGSGGSGGVAVGYQHAQTTPSTTWSINHGLGRRPSITTFDANNNQVFGSVVHHPPFNSSTVTFAIPLSGNAYAI